MNFDEHQGFFCNHFQDLLFSDKIVSGDASDKADVYRNLLVQSSYASNNNIVSPDAAEILMSDFNEQYVNIVDSFKENEGLNNFAEGALLICRQNRNESAQWKSSLTTSNVLKMDFVQELVKKSQEFSQKCQNQKLPECFNKSNPENISSINEKINQHLTSSSSSSSSNQTRITDFNWKQNLNGTNHKDPYMKNESVCPKPTAFAVIGGGTSPSPVNPDSHIYSKRADHYDSNHFMEHPSSDFLSTDKINERFYGNSMNRPVFSKQNLSSHSGPGYQQDNSVLRISDEQAFHQRNKQKFGRFPTQDTDNESEKNSSKSNNFRTAREQLVVNNQKKYGKSGNNGSSTTSSFSVNRKCLGTRRGLNSKFISPMHNRDQENYDGDSSSMKRSNGTNNEENEFVDERLKGIDPKTIEMIMNEIMDHGPGVNWNDIAGLEFAKKNIKEIVVWPMQRPDIFVGLRGPPKGLLLFGPPGTGKTLIGKCIASQSKSTFFSISASSLTSKWVGEGEKTVRALFAVARCHQPTVIFIDEIDSLLSQRSDNEHESSRRIKTEFLVQLDGATTESEERLLIIGATNRPHEIDEAARRRFVRRLYIPLPDGNARKQIIHNLLTKQKHFLGPEELETICQRTEGYSGSDMNNLCREAALGPIRSLPFGDIENITAEDVRPIEFSDFDAALLQVKASVSSKDLEGYIVWNEMYGSGSSK